MANNRGLEDGQQFLDGLKSQELPVELVEEASELLKTASRQLNDFGRDLKPNELIKYFRQLFIGTSFQSQSIKKKPDDYYEVYNEERAQERSGKVGGKYLSIQIAGFYIWFAQDGKKLHLTLAKVPSNGGWRSK